jgi:DEAD/DEAH box helicase domain-containing protein
MPDRASTRNRSTATPAEPWAPLLQEGREDERLVHEYRYPSQSAYTVPVPEELSPAVRRALTEAGIDSLYVHQQLAGGAAPPAATRPIIVTTGTASGKSLCFQLPTLEVLARDPYARALYIYPTKALAQDQARALGAFGLTRRVRPAIYDGDTPSSERSAIRKHANVLITNPDMLHIGILPHHDAWADFLANLAFIVIDEAHVYRGVFGSHVANVIRRLRRLTAHYGTTPHLLLASATIANPRELAAGLTGLPDVQLIDDDTAPAAARHVAVWNPPLTDEALGTRGSALAEAAEMLANLITASARTICFMNSRKGVELILRMTQDRLPPGLAERVTAYRAGYTPTQRHEIEGQLVSGKLLGVVATDALELGIDIGALDAAICVTFPGTVASLKQMWGRAGRRGRGLAVYIAGEDALDQFFARHPDEFLRRPVEAAIIDPESPEIRGAHLLCAALEQPLTEADEEYFGDRLLADAEQLTQAGLLRERASGFVPAAPGGYPAADVALRSSSGESFLLIDATTGEIMGTIEAARAYSTVHEGAVYLHRGRSYLVRELNLVARHALLEPFNGSYFTQTKRESMIYIERMTQRRLTSGVTLSYGSVIYSETVLGYQRKQVADHSVIDFQGLDLPSTEFPTRALWYELEGLIAGPGPLAGAGAMPGTRTASAAEAGSQPGTPTAAGAGTGEVPIGAEPFPADKLLGSLHALEHAQIAVLPLIAMCDRWDIGGLSTNAHPQTGVPTIFIYDGHPGGIGISQRGYEQFERLVQNARSLIAECPCQSGCPSCVQSPKCGNLNDPLSKAGALELLRRLQAAAA